MLHSFKMLFGLRYIINRNDLVINLHMMKNRYIAILIMLIVCAVMFEYVVLSTQIDDNSRVGNAIQSMSVFTALFAAVIALAGADPAKLSVKFELETSIDKEGSEEYSKDKLSDNLKKYYEEFPDPFKSYKVNFKVTNTSGFTWKNPNLTFRLPMSNSHPDVANPGRQAFNSNIHNFPGGYRQFHFQDTLVLSNSNLPYWNDKDNLTFWIRMSIHENLEPVVIVSVNCDNAEGINREVKIYQQT